MADQKVTTMVLKVDLLCRSCCKKIKKILAKFPRESPNLTMIYLHIYEIQSQTYDEKANTVTITVVCCNPEKFQDKLYCKGRKVIKSIEIKPPPKPIEKPPPPPPPKPLPPPKSKDPPPAPPTRIPVVGYLTMYLVQACTFDRPVRACDRPCYCGYGVPALSYDRYGGYGYGCGCGCGGTRGGNASRCDNYFSEENTTGCTIM